MWLIRLPYIYLIAQVYLALVVAIEQQSCEETSGPCSCQLENTGKIISLKQIDFFDKVRQVILHCDC